MHRPFVIASIAAALGACAPDADAPADAPPRPLELDVVITQDRVRVYTNASDLAASDCFGHDVFPAAGTTAWIDDVVHCKHGMVRSCLTSASMQLGTTEVISSVVPGRAIEMTGHVASAGGARLQLTGCGGSATIDLPAATAPQPTLSVVEDPITLALTSTWTATPPAASAVIEVINGTWGDAAHVTASPHVYAGRSGTSLPPYRVVSLQTFAPPTIAPTSFGPARIWTGGSTYVIVQETASHVP